MLLVSFPTVSPDHPGLSLDAPSGRCFLNDSKPSHLDLVLVSEAASNKHEVVPDYQ